MPAKKTSTPKKSSGGGRKPATRARSAEPSRAVQLRKPLNEAITEAREASHEFALAGLGMISHVQKARAARMAAFVKEGKLVEPKLRKAVEQWKSKLQSRVDTKFELPKLKFTPPRFDGAALRRLIEQRSS